MHPARCAICIPVMVLLCACAQNPASHDDMTEQFGFGALEGADLRSFPDTQLFGDSIGWHHEMFDHKALLRSIRPQT